MKLMVWYIEYCDCRFCKVQRELREPELSVIQVEELTRTLELLQQYTGTHFNGAPWPPAAPVEAVVKSQELGWFRGVK